MTAAGARVLVVGATGILAPAASRLVADGYRVTGAARGADGMPEGVEPFLVDAHDIAETGGRRWDAALIYCPAVTDASLAVLRAAVDGRAVLVRVSRHADPALGAFAVERDVLQLGWMPESAGARWHTPAEVSGAALEVLADGEGRVLGTVRPWHGRPGAPRR